VENFKNSAFSQVVELGGQFTSTSQQGEIKAGNLKWNIELWISYKENQPMLGRMTDLPC